jgi:hypothetical protein|nr:MAG TPA: Valyl-tRNA synthetase [Caudoviricetes sp.]
MDNIEKIIHGIDVSKCSHYNPLGNYNCSGTKKCSQWSNCYFKQLQRKTAECEELKAQLETYSKMLDNPEFKIALTDVRTGEREVWRKLGNKAQRYEQALDEIEKQVKAMNNECFYDDICDCNNCDMKNGCSYYRKFKILNIINKAKDGNNG